MTKIFFSLAAAVFVILTCFGFWLKRLLSKRRTSNDNDEEASRKKNFGTGNGNGVEVVVTIFSLESFFINVADVTTVTTFLSNCWFCLKNASCQDHFLILSTVFLKFKFLMGENFLHLSKILFGWNWWHCFSLAKSYTHNISFLQTFSFMTLLC